jgi:hypothetical protein
MYYGEFSNADRKDMIEWRIYNWVVAERALEKMGKMEKKSDTTAFNTIGKK